jgi:hypothetical protein
MQGHTCRQANTKTLQMVRPFTLQTKGMQEFFMDSRNNLTQSSQPTAPGLRPPLRMAALRQAEHLTHLQRRPHSRHCRPIDPLSLAKVIHLNKQPPKMIDKLEHLFYVDYTVGFTWKKFTRLLSFASFAP